MSFGHPSYLFWNQTPRVNQSALLGSIKRERRGLEMALFVSKWTGALAQADPRKQPSVATMLGEKRTTGAGPMTGAQIGATLRGLAARSAAT